MAAVTSLLEVTDTWVLDYLTRHCHPSVADSFKKDRDIDDKTPFDCPSGLTLEKVALQYFKSSHAPQNSVSFGRDRVWEPSRPLPQLVIREILSYLPTNDLFSTRLLSRDWNALSSESLRRRYRVPVWLQSVDQICKLGETFANRPNTNWLNPFVIYHFFPDQDGTLALLKLIGPDVKIGSFEFAAKRRITWDKVSSLLELTPDIEELCFYGNFYRVHVTGPVHLGHLRTLGLSRGPSPPAAKKRFQSFTNSTSDMNFPVLQSWLQIASALKELRCNFSLRLFSKEDFWQFAQLCRSLRVAAFYSIASSSPRDVGGQGGAILPNSDLTLEIGSVRKNLERGTTDLIRALSGSLNRLALTLEKGQVTFGELPRLTYLRISLNPRFSPAALQASSFPHLRSVTLECHVDPATSVHPFSGDIFPTVATLRLILHSHSRESRGYAWGSAFPAVTSLGVASAFFPAVALDDIVQNFDHVTRVHVCQIQRSGNSSLAETIFLCYYPSGWLFSTFKNLEDLELECAWDLRRLILEIKIFSAEKIMQPLQNLTIYHDFEDVERETVEFYWMRELNWHKNLNMIFRQEPSYKAW